MQSWVQQFSKFLQQEKRKAIMCTGHIKGLGMRSIAFVQLQDLGKTLYSSD
jgi:hypothetical protein